MPSFNGSDAPEFDAESPLSLAISAILALVPHPDILSAQESHVELRRRTAHTLAKRAMESIENDSEMPDSAIPPAQALAHGKRFVSRQPFHPEVPVELEGTIALCILTIYEYVQRGNISKMRDRAGQALISAMNQSLHSRGNESDHFSEARRRAWWMTYVCVCQASIVSCTAPTISPLDPRFTTAYPSIESDHEAWPIFIKSQQTILSATQFVVDLNQAMEQKANLCFLCDRMQELHSVLEPLVASSENWCRESWSSGPSDAPEAIVAHSLRCMSKIKLNSARIKLHRYCAFFDIPVFTEKHCDLDSLLPTPPAEEDFPQLPPCCSTALPIFSTGGTDSTIESSLNGSIASGRSGSPSGPASSISDFSVPGDSYSPVFPFSSHASSRICLKSALSIAQTFENLPRPAVAPSWQAHPRTMPSFACCAMQSAYALLMVYQKTWVMQVGDSQSDKYVRSLLEQCELGVRSVLRALENYSLAFEAIRGMKGKPVALPLHSTLSVTDFSIDQVREAVICLPGSVT